MKSTLYQGLLFKQLSKYQNLNKRKDCLSVATFSLKSDSSKAEKMLDKYDKDTCKIMVFNIYSSSKVTKIVKILKMLLKKL
jgi:hypothetical protein